MADRSEAPWLKPKATAVADVTQPPESDGSQLLFANLDQKSFSQLERCINTDRDLTQMLDGICQLRPAQAEASGFGVMDSTRDEIDRIKEGLKRSAVDDDAYQLQPPAKKPCQLTQLVTSMQNALLPPDGGSFGGGGAQDMTLGGHGQSYGGNEPQMGDVSGFVNGTWLDIEELRGSILLAASNTGNGKLIEKQTVDNKLNPMLKFFRFYAITCIFLPQQEAFRKPLTSQPTWSSARLTPLLPLRCCVSGSSGDDVRSGLHFGTCWRHTALQRRHVHQCRGHGAAVIQWLITKLKFEKKQTVDALLCCCCIFATGGNVTTK